MSTATDMLAAYLAAEEAILAGKTATIGDHSFGYEDLEKVRAGRLEWERRVAVETRQAAGDYGSARCQLASFSD